MMCRCELVSRCVLCVSMCIGVSMYVYVYDVYRYMSMCIMCIMCVSMCIDVCYVYWCVDVCYVCRCVLCVLCVLVCIDVSCDGGHGEMPS